MICDAMRGSVTRSSPELTGPIEAAESAPSSGLDNHERSRPMPGLLRGVARAAVVTGTATAVSGRVQRRQAARFAERDANIYAELQHSYEQQQPNSPTPTASLEPRESSTIQQLKDLAELKEQGVLTDAEFAAEKSKILSR
jgi:hypothetical protein